MADTGRTLKFPAPVVLFFNAPVGIRCALETLETLAIILVADALQSLVEFVAGFDVAASSGTGHVVL